MGVKPDHWIIEMAERHEMIAPFVKRNIGQGRISFGISAYGYDFRLDRQFRHCRAAAADLLDPKQETAGYFEDVEADSVAIPPGSFVLARSLEYFKIPRDVLGLCTGKSTYARCGILVNVTPLEPEWEGYLTVCVVNGGPARVRIHAGEGIGQLIFLEATQPCQTSYKDKKGKYQGQRNIVHSRVEGDPPA